MSERTYLPKCRARMRETPFGDVLNVRFDAASLVEFVKTHTNARGYFNISLMPRRNPDEHQTHSVMWDSWEPTNSKPLDAARRAVESVPAPKHDDSGDIVPF